MADFSMESRVSALEADVAKLQGPVEIGQLPLAQLQRSLSLHWTVNPNDILQPKSITAALLDDAVVKGYLGLATAGIKKVAFGSDTFAWAASALSGLVTITHGLAAAPVAVVGAVEVTTGSTNDPLSFQVLHASLSTTQFVCQGRATTAITESEKFYWLAIA